MITLVIILIVAVAFDIVGFIYENTELNAAGCLSCLGRLVLISFAALFIIYSVGLLNKGREPNAIDLYKGDAEVKIVYTDSIPTDTIVVWKDDCKREW